PLGFSFIHPFLCSPNTASTNCTRFVGPMTDRWFAQIERLLFGLMLAVPALLGVALISIAHTFAHDSLAHDLVRDLGVASFVSVIVTVVIELYPRNRLQTELRSLEPEC